MRTKTVFTITFIYVLLVISFSPAVAPEVPGWMEALFKALYGCIKNQFVKPPWWPFRRRNLQIGGPSSLSGKQEPLLPQSNKMQINVRKTCGKLISLIVDKDDPIDSLKQEIAEKEGIPVDRQQYYLASLELDGLKSFQHYNLDKFNEITLIPLMKRREKKENKKEL